MKNLYVTFGLFFFLFGCKNSVIEQPKNLIDEDKMVAILYDYSIFDAVRNQNMTTSLSAYNPNTYIYKKYKIDSLQFAQSNRYYSTNISKYKKMYKKVAERLENYKNQLNNSSKIETKIVK